MRVLVTGGAGYIGSHTLVELLGKGHEALVVDSFSNGSRVALDRVRALTNGHFDVLDCDIRDTMRLSAAARDFRPEAVIHFAGLKAVGESQRLPVEYYDVNVSGTLSLLRAMAGARCKLMAEQVLSGWARATEGAVAILLRYFNPVGAHPSGRLGEDPQGVPENLMPYLAQVATGEQERLRIFGDDYPTPDGTGVRDYIHVVDLARAHVAALDHAAGTSGVDVFNIGTGRGYSVKEMLAAFSAEVGRDLPCEVVGRRPGDVAEMRADCSKAGRVLGWRAEFGLDRMVRDLWRWQKNHPRGYRA